MQIIAVAYCGGPRVAKVMLATVRWAVRLTFSPFGAMDQFVRWQCRIAQLAPPPRARLSLQPLISSVCRTNATSHLRSRFAVRKKVRGGRQPAQTFSRASCRSTPLWIAADRQWPRWCSQWCWAV